MDTSTTSLARQGQVNIPQAATTSFRFLDLPAEMRNRVYDCVADSIEECPILLANRKIAGTEIPKPDVGKLASKHKKLLLDLSTFTKCRNVFTILLVSRQITREARTIIEEAVGRSGLDLRFTMLESSLHKMRQLQESWASKLYLIKHLTVEHEVADWFIFADTKDRVELWEWYWDKYYGSQANAKQARRLQDLLPNVESMTVHTMSNSVYENMTPHYGQMMASDLADVRQRDHLHKFFPRLIDIKCMSSFDGQRFKKENGVWRSWYTAERVSP